MAQNIGNMIAASCSLGISYADRLLTDVQPEHFARFACPGGVMVTSNHPAFIFGHLSLYAPRIVEQLGGNVDAARPPKNFECLFSKDATCQDDPNGTIYPAKDIIVDTFYTGIRAALEILHSTDDELFRQENPTEGPLRDRFPTLGAMHAFYVSGHMMNHFGQMSAWRRMMGLGAC